MQIFHDALTSGKHSCYLRPDCMLPMMYIDDCLQSLHSIMIAPDDQLSCRVYNVAAMSFTPEMILKEIRKHVPDLQIEYKVDDRQKIGIFHSELILQPVFAHKIITADEWPQVFDDSQARQDWGWQHDYDLDHLVEIMINNLKKVYTEDS